MWSLGIAGLSALSAIVVALWHMCVTVRFVSYDSMWMRSFFRGTERQQGWDRLREAMGCLSARTAPDAWEKRLVEELAAVETGDYDRALAHRNEAMLDVDAGLTPNTRLYAVCARICVFGCLLATALLFMSGKMLTVTVIDVFAIATAGVLITLVAAKQTRRFVTHERERIDAWMEAMMASKWPAHARPHGPSERVQQ